jgi:hypothetical protein
MPNPYYISVLLARLITIPAWAQVSAPDTLSAHNSDGRITPGLVLSNGRPTG